MPRRRYIFDPPERFVAGTVGEPGDRTFFLQARDGGRVTSVVLEKVQVAVLADRLNRLLDELEQRGVTAPGEAAIVDVAAPDVAPLDEPIVEAFRAGTLTLGWDGDADRVLVEARARTEEDEDEETLAAELEEDDDAAEGPDIFRVRLTAPAARAFVERAVRVVASGRPPCPLCGEPLDPQGHTGPRRNGHYVNCPASRPPPGRPVRPRDGRRRPDARRHRHRRPARRVDEPRDALSRRASLCGRRAADRDRCGVQARRRRAAARRLPRRDAEPSRGRRVRGFGGDAVADRAAHDPA